MRHICNSISNLRIVGKALALIGLSGFWQVAAAELIFSEDFDSQPDWTSAMHSTDIRQNHLTHTIPEGWHIIRQDPSWAPSKGHPDRHEVIEITSQSVKENSNRARGGKGKSFVTWRDSYDPGWNRWNSDGIMFFKLPGKGLRNVYVEFWVNFSKETIETFYNDGLGSSKILRVMSHDFPEDVTNSEYFSFFGSNHKPMFLWDIGGGLQYGVRNMISIYREKTAAKPLNENVVNFPRSFNGNGDNSLSYSKAMTQGHAIGGGTPNLKDLRAGGDLPEGNVYMDQIFGDESTWVKLGFYIEMNSAPGVPDGKLYQYVDDQRILKGEGIEWQTAAQPADKLWNLVGIGGNDFFQSYSNSARHEEWYAIDDLVIRSDLPAHLRTGTTVSPPNPPSKLVID